MTAEQQTNIETHQIRRRIRRIAFWLLPVFLIALFILVLEFPRLLARSVIHGKWRDFVTSAEIQYRGTRIRVDGEELRNLLSDMANPKRVDTTDAWDEKALWKEDIRFFVTFHFPFGSSVPLACDVCPGKDFLFCWMSKDPEVYQFFIWRDPQPWQIQLTHKYEFIERLKSLAVKK